MLGLQACPAAQLQPSSSKGWCPIQYSSHRLSPLAELQYAFCIFMMFSLQVLLLHSPIHCLDHGQDRIPQYRPSTSLPICAWSHGGRMDSIFIQDCSRLGKLTPHYLTELVMFTRFACANRLRYIYVPGSLKWKKYVFHCCCTMDSSQIIAVWRSQL